MSAAHPAADSASLMDRMYRRQRHIYDLTRKFYLLGRDDLIASLAPPPGARVLEMGCGTGRNLILAARRYPTIRAYGIDVSSEMLATARAEIATAGLTGRIVVAQADATGFDAAALLGATGFERVFISYALSMIPPWREAVAEAARHVAPGGSLDIVDFGDQADLPAGFRRLLKAWLALFEVHPRVELEAELSTFAKSRDWRLTFSPLYRRYAFLARLQA